MPLPTGNPEWPPTSERAALELYREHQAWWSGDPAALSEVYGAGLGGGAAREFYEDPHKGTALGRAFRRVVRYFWGQPAAASSAPTRLHVPLASELCEGSAQLLFEEMPRITLPGGAGQERLEAILDESGAHAVLLEGAEMCAAYGGVYLRASWDTDLAGVPLLDVIAPDAAVPEFSRGRLTAVTFWRVVHDDRGTVWRHLERHAPGAVEHGLYAGTRDRLGRPVPLTDHPTTAGLAELVDANGAVPTGHPGLLTAAYVPNMGPNRRLRGAPLGRSDLDGIEQLLDQLDEVWSSWGREHRLGVARAILPAYMLRDLGAGNGARFDDMAEFFVGINVPPADGATTGQSIEFIQPELRIEAHSRSCTEIAIRAIRGAGYSAATHGETGDGPSGVTATEIHDRHRLTLQTRARKIGYWRSPLSAIVEALLAIDAAVFPGQGTVVARPDVEWPDGVAVDPEALSRTVVGFATAEAASIRTRVAMVHPDWDEAAVDEEVDRIRDDRGADGDPYASAANLGGFQPAGDEDQDDGDEEDPGEG